VIPASYLRAWLSAFLFTQLVEMPIYRRGLGVSWLAAFGASALTHPIVWFVIFHDAVRWDYTTKAVAAELFAWLAEAAYFRFCFGRKKALVWALLANAASVALGLISRALFGAP
jgi:hypothetical protein